MPRVKDRQFYESARYNNAAFRDYYDNFTEIAVSTFQWKNLPDTIDPRYLELVLFSDGKAILFNDDVLGWIVLRCNDHGGYDIYNKPIRRTAFANNGYHNTDLTIDNSVIIYNNYLRKPTAPVVEYYAKRLWDIDRTIDVNIHAQKTPYLITCNEEDLLTLKNIYAKIDGNEQVIYAKKGLDLDSIKVLNTNSNFISPELYNLRTRIYNECLEKLGIDTVQNEKSQYLSIDETHQGNGSVISNRYSRLDSRRMACKEALDVLGLDIWVDYKDLTSYDTSGNIELSGFEDNIIDREVLE